MKNISNEVFAYHKEQSPPYVFQDLNHSEIFPYLIVNIGSGVSMIKVKLTWGPFLGRPGKLTGPVSYFEIKVSRKVGCVLTSNEVHFVSLAENLTV